MIWGNIMGNLYICLIILAISCIANMFIGYKVFGGQYEEDTQIDYGTSDFGTKASSVILFY